MREHTIRRALVALIATASLAAVPAASSAATATVRVEGELATLAPAQSWTIGSSAVDPLTGCPGDTVSAAIEAVTGGNWDRRLFVETILGERHAFGARDEYWAFWQNNDLTGLGACAQTLANGDELLVQATMSDPSSWLPTSMPVELTAPTIVNDGVPFGVKVTEWVGAFTGSSTSRDGVNYLVSDGTVTSAPTNATGDSSLTLTGSGPTTIRATSADPGNWGRSVDVAVCVEDGTGVC